MYTVRVIPKFLYILGCSRYRTRSSSTKRKFDLTYYSKGVQEKKNSTFTFNGVFFIHRPENTPLAVKFRFFDWNRQGDYYDVGKLRSLY